MESYRGIALPAIQQTSFRLSPSDTVAEANRIASIGAMEPVVRAIAADVVGHAGNVPKVGPDRLARWVRDNIRYTQEATGLEVLQGPITTLRLETGDCDDLSILWTALCRSIGIEAFVVGLREHDQSGYYHAVGYAGGQLFELSRDQRYGGPRRGHRMAGVPRGSVGLYYDPIRQSSSTLAGRAKKARASVDAGAMAADAAALGVEFSDSVLQGTRAGDAIGIVARAAGSGAAAGMTAAGVASGQIAAALGVAGAAGPIGAVVGCVIALAVLGSAIAKTEQNRNRAADRANELLELLAVIAEGSGLHGTPAQTLRVRLIEAIPVLSGTIGMHGRGSRRLHIATLTDYTPPAGCTWSDGARVKRRGVYNVFFGKSGGATTMANVMAGHVTAARALVDAMAGMPLAERQRLLSVALQVALGPRGLHGVPLPLASLSSVSAPRRNLLRPALVAGAIAAAIAAGVS